MSKNLVIVESPAKAKTINKILGKDFVVRASLGHVRDLPQKKLGVDIDKGFKPSYEIIAGRRKTIKELQDIARDAEAIYLAPDPDREGEAIAWHLMYALKGKNDANRFYRVTYNEITAPAIRKAFANPTRIDQNKVDAQQARRVLDRLVGYKVSPLLWRRVRGGSSAGRVQSVALRLVCEREEEIRNFTPVEYWILGARVRKRQEPLDPFAIRLAKINGEKAEIKTSEEAERVRNDLSDRELRVAAINDKEISRRARPPFITSTLQQSASSFLGYSPARTMSIAQKLYEGMDFGDGPTGLITYMRTDSPFISKEAQDTCRAYIRSAYGDAYIPEKPNFYKSRGGAQEAHEAIRPTDVDRTPDSLASILKPEELKLYRMIWQRFVSSQMTPARINQRTVEITAEPSGGDRAAYLFRVTASSVIFDGFMRVTGEDKIKKKPADGNGDDAADEEADALPPLTEGEALDCLEWLSDQKFTKPPPRYSEASLVRALEENGVGRPSTYAQILSTLNARQYVEREKQQLRPTDLGERVCQFLVATLNELFDVQFTANMEKSLDEIEEGRVEWTGMMAEFYKTFSGWLEQAKGPDADPHVVAQLCNLFDQVQDWAPASKRGKRTYSDQEFVASVRKQLEEEGKKVTQRQVEALIKMAVRYKDQLPDLQQVAEAAGVHEDLSKAHAEHQPPRQETISKLEILKRIQFNEPRTVGKRTYDDSEFCASLRQQVEGGKRLSLNQIKYLDRLVMKYADQIEGFEEKAREWDLKPEAGVSGDEIQGVLDAYRHIQTWSPPVQRGKREWDDRKFFESLTSQFEHKKSLSEKQAASLKKMLTRYAAQIPDYELVAQKLNLPERKKRAAKKQADAGESHGEA